MSYKIIVPLIFIVVGISWLAFSNLSNANYFYPVNELPEMGDKLYEHGLRVKGRIVAGSIRKDPKPIRFTIKEEEAELEVRYVGEEPLPDLFKDRAEAVVDGKMAADGVFEAEHLQAKCSSKYESLPPEASEGQAYSAEYGDEKIAQSPNN